MAKKKTNSELYETIIKMIPFLTEKYDDKINYANIISQIRKKNSNVIKCLFENHKPSSIEDVEKLLDKLSKYKRGLTLDRCLFVYGPIDGQTKWNEYRAMQSKTNTFEYKKDKFGYNENDFKNFNKNRACTEANFIKRHGETLGKTKWKNYCERQKFTNTKEYLKDRYEKVNKQKAINYENMLRVHGSHELAIEALEKHHNSSSFGVSKISQILFKHLVCNNLFANKKYYFYDENKEYGIYDNLTKSYYKYDFVCPELNLCIEFNGDDWRGNPSKYKACDYLKKPGSKIKAYQSWATDARKISALKRNRGFDVLIIWEKDYNKNPREIEEKIINEIRKIRKL